jgi:hypothetical protein
MGVVTVAMFLAIEMVWETGNLMLVSVKQTPTKY